MAWRQNRKSRKKSGDNAAGDLFESTYAGGAGDGLVYEIAKNGGGYASAPTTLINFSPGGAGAGPQTALIFEAAGDLFGTTSAGGNNDDATVLEIAKTIASYADTATTLVNLDQLPGSPLSLEPRGGLSIDAARNLFGVSTYGGANDDGFVFEIAKTNTGYATTAATLLNLRSLSTTLSYALAPGPLTFDAAGNFLGTTPEGGAYGDGAVFEIAKTGAGSTNSATILTNFRAAGGQLQ